MDLNKYGVTQIHVIQNMIQWNALLNTEMNYCVP